jgi:hypothetical protein
MFDNLFTPFHLIALLPYLLVTTAIYISPILVAIYRNHRSRLQIAMLNILLGWTVIGWAVALIWAVSPPAPVIAVE